MEKDEGEGATNHYSERKHRARALLEIVRRSARSKIPMHAMQGPLLEERFGSSAGIAMHAPNERYSEMGGNRTDKMEEGQRQNSTRGMPWSEHDMAKCILCGKVVKHISNTAVCASRLCPANVGHEVTE